MLTTASRSMLLAVLVLGALVYWPGLNGDFVFDDHQNIVDNNALRPEMLSSRALATAALSSDSGPLRRPVASLTFLANYHLFGIGPKSFKITNVLIHLLNGYLVFLVLRRILPAFLSERSDAVSVASFGALIWTLHPLNLTAVLYVVQRMTSLAATFTLLALLCYCAARQREVGERGLATWRLWLGVIALWSLGLATKETAVLFPCYAFVLELTVFKFRGSRWLKRFSMAGIVGVGFGLFYLIGPLDYLETAYRGRHFTADERLLTELRILVFYLEQILLPSPTRMALLHGNWTLSSGLWEPLTTFGAAIFWLTAITVATMTSRRYPFVTFGIAWYLGGHLLESTFIPLELIYEHRNYLPMLGPLCSISVGVTRVLHSSPSMRTLLAGGTIVILATMTGYRAWQWSDPFTLALTEARHNPESARARMEFGRVNFQQFLVDKRPELLATTRDELRAAIEYGIEDYQPLVSLVNTYVMTKEPVPEALLQALEHEMRTRSPAPRWLDGIIVAIKCQISRGCPTVPEVVLRVVSAGLENPRLRPPAKAEILEWLALYYVNVLGDFAAANRVLQVAVEAQPESWAYRLRWAEVMAGQKNWDAVERELALISNRLTTVERIIEPNLATRYDALRRKLAVRE